MEREALKARCVAKLSPRCTSEENAIEIYEDMVLGISQAAWHLMDLTTRDAGLTTAIIQVIKDDVCKIVLQRWADDSCAHFPNNSDVAHAIGTVLLALTMDQKGGETA